MHYMDGGSMLKEVYKEAEDPNEWTPSRLWKRTWPASALVEQARLWLNACMSNIMERPTPLIQLAAISVPEPRSLLIRPFDALTLKAIERASWPRTWA